MHVRVPCISTSLSSWRWQQGVWAWVCHRRVLDFLCIFYLCGTRSWTLPSLTLMQLPWLCHKMSKFFSLKCPNEEKMTSEALLRPTMLPACQETVPMSQKIPDPFRERPPCRQLIYQGSIISFLLYFFFMLSSNSSLQKYLWSCPYFLMYLHGF